MTPRQSPRLKVGVSRVRSPGGRAASHRLAVEPLENRLLPAVSLLDIVPGSAGSSPWKLTDVNGTVFFSAETPATGRELWKTDGTEAGTVLVKDIWPGSASSSPDYLTNVGGTLFFATTQGGTHNELWKSDGTAEGTVLVKSVGVAGRVGFFEPTPVNGTLFFVVSHPCSSEQCMSELWKSDGTAAGTQVVKDIYSGYGGYGYGLPIVYGLTNLSGTLFFSAADRTHGRELWRSDGTAAGTQVVKDIYSGYGGYGYEPPIVYGLTNVSGTLFFSAADLTHGRELWRSDGTEAGTVMVKDINPGSVGSGPGRLTDVNGTLYFTTSRYELWKSDGTEAGTVLVKSGIDRGSGPGDLTNVGGTLFFSAADLTHGSELWRSDGTEAGTVMVKDINPGIAVSLLGSLTDVNGTLYFRAYYGPSGYELWKSDGTEAGTVLVKDLRPGHGSSFPFPLANVGGALFFSADDGVHGRELWVLPPPQVTYTFVNDLTAQRSYVFGLGVLFNTAVTLDPGAFEVRAGAIDGPVSFVLFSGMFEGGSWAYLVFPDLLADGAYTLTVHGDRVHDGLGRALDGDGDGTPGGDYAAGFHRLWGDLDGDRDVDEADLALFDEGLAAALWYLDMDGDGDADGDDRALLAGRVGTSL